MFMEESCLKNTQFNMKTFIIIIISLALSGCCLTKPTLKFSPVMIPTGEVGEIYYVKIETLFIASNIKFNTNNLDNGLNLNIIYPTKQGGASRSIFEISGKPQSEGSAQLIVEGSTPGTSCTGQHFRKIFTITILKENQAQNTTKITPTDTEITTTCL